MGQEPRIYWKDSHNCYYYNRKVNGKTQQVRLDPDLETARQLYHAQLAEVENDLLVTEVLGRFLEHHKAKSSVRHPGVLQSDCGIVRRLAKRESQAADVLRSKGPPRRKVVG